MSNIRKLAQFRQLSLNCETPPPSGGHQRRKHLKKQYSEDATDGGAIRVSLNAKNNKKEATDKPPPVRMAWGDKSDDAVIVKKCREVRRPASGKLTRHGSLEKDSILCSKQELTDRINVGVEKEPKPNLKIFLAHNVQNTDNTDQYSERPKFIQPLVANLGDKSTFQIKKTINRQNKNEPFVGGGGGGGNTVVVVPVTEQEINVVIRPSTATARREKFQKRTNSAFHSPVVNESQSVSRPPLVRSSSAPSGGGKFLATKRKLKAPKRAHSKTSDNPSPDCAEWKNAASDNTDVETMVELISPTASDTEDQPQEEESAEKPKSALKQDKSEGIAEGKKDPVKGMTLRKAVKSVTFQQSSIHAIRSFSASFPARRASMALSLGVKTHEKRSTNSTLPDADERVPKRRLVRTGTEDHQPKVGNDVEPSKSPAHSDNTNFSIDIQAKSREAIDVQETSAEIRQENDRSSSQSPIVETAKEKQCWDMYCKMTDKGIAVSYDTILRGMLTPTEYRMRRKTSIADEMKLLSENVPSSKNE